MSTDYHSLTVRAPWADELPRMKVFFQAEPLNLRQDWHLQVIIAPEPERIIGAMALRAEGESGELRFNLRPRIQQEGHSQLAWEAMAESARKLGIQRLFAQVDHDSPQEDFLRKLGFQEMSVNEAWQISLADAQARLKPLLARLTPHRPLVIRTPEPADIPALQAFVASLGLNGRENIRFQNPDTPSSTDPDSRLSTIIRSQYGDMLGTLLASGGNGLTCRINICAVAGEQHGYSRGILIAKLIRQSLEAALNVGYITASFTLNPIKYPAARKLAACIGGKLSGSRCCLEQIIR